MKLKKGDRVHWTDPDGDLCSGDGTVASDDGEIIAIDKDDGGVVGALREELTLLERGDGMTKMYNVLFETNYENEDVHSTIEAFDSLDKACKCLEDALADETRDGGYTEEELETRLRRDGYDHFCFYKDDSLSNWKFRGVVYECEVK